MGMAFSRCNFQMRGLTREVQYLKIQAASTCQTFHSAPQTNSPLHADAKTGMPSAFLWPASLPSAHTGSGAG